MIPTARSPSRLRRTGHTRGAVWGSSAPPAGGAPGPAGSRRAIGVVVRDVDRPLLSCHCSVADQLHDSVQRCRYRRCPTGSASTVKPTTGSVPMIRSILVPTLLALSSPLTGVAQAPDTTALLPSYRAVVALRSRYEKEHGHVALLQGIPNHYLDWGPTTATPLIWLHGSASNGYEIRHLAPTLVAAGYRVIALDYRGHGQTRVDNYEFTIWDLADDVVALMDQLHISRAVIGGASKGGFIAAAVYDQYKSRVSGLLLADGGSWSNQWNFDHHGLDGARREVAGAPPAITGRSELEVLAQLVGPPPPQPIDPERLLDPLLLISPRADGSWAFLDGFDKLMGTAASYLAGATAPSTMPLLQWSQHAMLPLAVFRHLAIPVMVLDPEEADDNLPVGDQNDRLAALHPGFIIHQRYPDTGHNVVKLRPEWFLRDAGALLARVKGTARNAPAVSGPPGARRLGGGG